MNKTVMPTYSLFSKTALEVLAGAIRQDKERKNIEIRKKEVTLSLIYQNQHIMYLKRTQCCSCLFTVFLVTFLD